MIETSRRGFLQLSASGTAALAIGSGLATLTGCSKKPATAQGYKVLREGDLLFLGALAPAILVDAYPGPLGANAHERLLKQLDTILNTLQGHARGELLMMFDLMNSAPLRLATGAPWGSWGEASAEDADNFLNSWKHSSLQIKRMGYSGLCKLITISWYSQPENFPTTGYPGPPVKIPTPVSA
jgi:hypothetical protein